jgi:voltage-gated potassium channel
VSTPADDDERPAAPTSPAATDVEFHLAELGLPRWYELLVLGAAGLTVPAATVQFFVDEQPLETIAHVVNFVTWLVFASAIARRAAGSGSPRAWLRAHPLDVVVAVFSLPLFPYPMQLLRGIWILGLVRATGLQRRIFSGASIKYAVSLVLLTVLGGGSLFSALEPHTDVGVGVYWAMTTVTTVGYGDVAPTTEATRVLAVLVMSIGILSLGFLTAAASERFMRSMRAGQAAPPEPVAAAAPAVLVRLDEIAARLDRIEARLAGPPDRPA